MLAADLRNSLAAPLIHNIDNAGLQIVDGEVAAVDIEQCSEFGDGHGLDVVGTIMRADGRAHPIDHRLTLGPRAHLVDQPSIAPLAFDQLQRLLTLRMRHTGNGDANRYEERCVDTLVGRVKSNQMFWSYKENVGEGKGFSDRNKAHAQSAAPRRED